MKMSGAKALVECLKKEKVKHIFGYPGGAIMPVYDELYKDKSITHILTRHEQGAAHAAEGYAKASGEVGVAMSTSGPGGTNLITGIADAYMDSVPIVAFSGQVVTPQIGNDAFQEADMFGLTMPMTKHNFKVTDPKELVHTVRSAFYIARTGRPGPVHVDLPKDIQTAEIEFDYPKEINLRGYSIKIEPHPLQISRAVDMLLAAEKPLLLAGGGTIIANASDEVVALAEMLLIPVVTTTMAKGIIPETHPLSLGVGGMHGRKISNYALVNCDLLLAVGTRFSDRLTFDLRYFAPNAKIIHIDIDSAEIGKNVNVDLPIVGDAKKALSAIIREVKKRKAKICENEWRQTVAKLKEMCECSIAYDEVPIKPQRVIYELNKNMPENTIFVTEVGQNQMWASHFLKVKKPRHYITSGGLGTMGFGLPASIGAKAARPDQPVLDIGGDGSVLMVIQELATSVEENLPIIVCILNNNWLGMVKQWQKLFMEKRYSETHLGKMPDFVKLAHAFHCDGERVSRPGELKGALQRALKSDVTYIIDVAIDPEEDVLPMVPPGGRIDQMIPSKVCKF
ncbi:MAG: biosynthetic-type acetolactate synthase large subunit [Candidatus Micrarchaeia archaeon]